MTSSARLERGSRQNGEGGEGKTLTRYSRVILRKKFGEWLSIGVSLIGRLQRKRLSKNNLAVHSLTKTGTKGSTGHSRKRGAPFSLKSYEPMVMHALLIS